MDDLVMIRKYPFKKLMGTFLMVQWLGICLVMQGVQVQSLFRE